jgi:hypothetical protein
MIFIEEHVDGHLSDGALMAVRSEGMHGGLNSRLHVIGLEAVSTG